MQTSRRWLATLSLVMLLALLVGCGNQEGDGADASAGGQTATTAATVSPPGATVVTDTETALPVGATEVSGAATAAAGGNGQAIRIGSKDFTEAVLMAEMYAQLLEANGFTVERKFRLGAEQVAHQALLNDEIDLYPEYTSTGLLTILKMEPINDPQKVWDTVKSEYEKQFKLTWLRPSPFNDTNGLAMTRQRAEELGIKTYSDLAAKSQDLVVGGPPEFYAREDGLPGLQKAYGGFEFKENRQLDIGLRYRALEEGQVDVIRVFTTEGQLGSPDLVVLQDDKNYYPIYQVAPVIRMDTLEANPQIADILNKLDTPALDDKTMAALNYKIDGPEKQEIPSVARRWLTEQGLLK